MKNQLANKDAVQTKANL